MRGNPSHFDERLFARQAAPGIGRLRGAGSARTSSTATARAAVAGARVQDRYSIRCAPHVIGVLLDALAMFRPILETEVNSVNDNPIVDAERDEILHGGNFYGGHVAFAMDGLKTAVANVADLLRPAAGAAVQPGHQPRPAREPGGAGRRGASVAHHGFKAMQITASALTAEALKLTMPASVFSRSTESHNQDKVSMGSIAARDCQRVLELTETVAIVELLALCQARRSARRWRAASGAAAQLHAAVRALAARNDGDRRQDVDIAAVLALFRRGRAAVRSARTLHDGARAGRLRRAAAAAVDRARREARSEGAFSDPARRRPLRRRGRRRPSTSTRCWPASPRRPGLYARFREDKHITLLQQPLVSEGSIYFAPPARFARQTEKPIESTLIIDGNQLQFGGADGQESMNLGANPVASLFADSFVMLLSGNRAGPGADLQDELAPRAGKRAAARTRRRAMRARMAAGADPARGAHGQDDQGARAARARAGLERAGRARERAATGRGRRSATSISKRRYSAAEQAQFFTLPRT